jgi:hypothetical protein
MRIVIGTLLILHGLAHAGAGMWAAGPVWLITLLWWLATALYISAGLGVLGFKRYSPWTAELAFAAVIPSALLLGSFIGAFVAPGIALDLLLLVAVVRLRDRLEPVPAKPPRYRGTAATVLAMLFLVYTSGVILLRPWAMRMGTTAEDRRAELFGDSLNPGARYRVDNAITIDAPADSVWPWIAQIGQDRGGFYSYDRLERLFGVRIRNADSIVPAWQERKVGELVRCCQPTYLGGLFGDKIGWRVEAIEPGRGIALRNWGAFVVVPIDSSRSRFYIRQRNPGTPSFVGNLFAPVGLLVMEPAHFIMQYGMLRGVKARAERS